jgi:predicted homoserine dehydrogenase-like protein
VSNSWGAVRIAKTVFVASGAEACAHAEIEVVVEATGVPAAGIAGRKAGGILDRDGMVEVISCLERDGRPVFRDLRWGVFVVVKASAVAKRTLRAGEMLNGEGGCTVWGKLVPAERSLGEGALPIGLVHRIELLRDVAPGEILCWSDVQNTGERGCPHPP